MGKLHHTRRKEVLCFLCEEEMTRAKEGICIDCHKAWAVGEDVEAFLAEETGNEMVLAAIGDWFDWHGFYARKDDVANISLEDMRGAEQELTKVLIALSGAHRATNAEQHAKDAYSWYFLPTSESGRDLVTPGSVVGETLSSKFASSDGPAASAYLVEKEKVLLLQRANELIRAMLYAEKVRGEEEGGRLLVRLADGEYSANSFNEIQARHAAEVQRFKEKEEDE